MNTIVIVLPILTLLMFDLGLALRPADFRLIAQRPKAVVAGLTGQILLLPLLAWAVASGPFVFNNDVMAVPAIIYALMMNIILLTYVGVVKVRQRAQ